MKNIFNKNTDVLADIKMNKNYPLLAKAAEERIRLAVEVFNAREKLHLSQQVLAKAIGTTQKVISRIENGDVNVGMALVGRISEKLKFDSETFARIFQRPAIWTSVDYALQSSEIKTDKREVNYINESLITYKGEEQYETCLDRA